METIKGGSSPAFPADSTSNGYGGRTPQTYSGLTIQQYAAIHLRVPNSGDAALDEMIRQSLRDELAARAMQGMLSNPKLQPEILKQGGANSGWIEESSFIWAESMLKARKEGGAA